MNNINDDPISATNLYQSGFVSLTQAAKLSGLSLSEFIGHLGTLNIEVVRYDETVAQEVQDVSQWLTQACKA